MAFKVIRGDIRNCIADAIVIPANPKPIIGKGVDRLIYHEAGRNRLLKERRKIGDIDFGHACITDAYDLRDKGVKYIIHAVSPAYDGGKSGERDLLRACYTNALTHAFGHGCKTVVFPLLSTGVLGYPKKEAQEIAESACKSFCLDHEIDVSLILYESEEELEEDRRKLAQYIEENCYSNLDVEYYRQKEREWGNLPEWREEKIVLELMRKRYARMQADEAALRRYKNKQKQYREAYESNTIRFGYITSFDSFYEKAEKRPTFSEIFERFKENKKAGTYADICRKANLREDTLSKLRRESVNPHRDYLWALAIAMKLSLEETEELFNSCGLSIHGSFRFYEIEERRERALEFFVIQKWGINKVNRELRNMRMMELGNRVH